MKTITGDLQAKGLRFGIAISRFNDLLTKNLLEAAVDGLVRHGVHSDDITVVWVPGAFELPTVLKQLAVIRQVPRPDRAGGGDPGRHRARRNHQPAGGVRLLADRDGDGRAGD
jgi:hypothetical protein